MVCQDGLHRLSAVLTQGKSTISFAKNFGPFWNASVFKSDLLPHFYYELLHMSITKIFYFKIFNFYFSNSFLSFRIHFQKILNKLSKFCWTCRCSRTPSSMPFDKKIAIEKWWRHRQDDYYCLIQTDASIKNTMMLRPNVGNTFTEWWLLNEKKTTKNAEWRLKNCLLVVSTTGLLTP